MAAEKTTPPINVDYFEDLTGDIATSAEKATAPVGDRIRRLRENKGLSIKELSQLTGFDEQMLEEIEANVLSPQLGTMIKLSKALDAAFQRLIADEGQKLYAVTRRQDRKVVTRSTSQKGKKSAYTYMSLAAEVKGRHMEPLVVQLEEKDDEHPSVHAGEEFIFVMDGVVVLEIGDERLTLEPGDSAYYLSTTPHVLSAAEGRATILAVIYSE
ncbi:MAG: XRE family transcriptional regulator [Desulfosarcinaceae bacterium]